MFLNIFKKNKWIQTSQQYLNKLFMSVKILRHPDDNDYPQGAAQLGMFTFWTEEASGWNCVVTCGLSSHERGVQAFNNDPRVTIKGSTT